MASRQRRDGWDEARAPVISSLLRLCDSPEAGKALLLPPSVADGAVSANLAVLSAPTRAALDRYCGVLYEGLDAASLSPTERRSADRCVLIFSGLFGVLTAGEAVPEYRVPAKAVLPGIGTAASYWRGQLASLLPERLGSGLVVDLRSTDYRAMWQPSKTGVGTNRVATVRVLNRRPSGSLGVISYPSKHHKGRLAAALVRRAAAGSTAHSVDDIVDTWRELGGVGATVRGLSVDLVAGD